MAGRRKPAPKSKCLHVRVTEEEWRLVREFCRSITKAVRPHLEPLFSRLRGERQRRLQFGEDGPVTPDCELPRAP